MSQRPGGDQSQAARKEESRDALLARLSRLESLFEEERSRTNRVMRTVERAKRSGGGRSASSAASRSPRPPTESRAESGVRRRETSRSGRETGHGDHEERYFGRRLSDVTRLERDLRLTSVRPTALFATVAKTGGKVNMSRRQTDVTQHHDRWQLQKPAPPDPDHDTKCFRHVRDDITRDAEEIERSRVRQ